MPSAAWVRRSRVRRLVPISAADRWQFAQVHRHRDGQAGPGGDLATSAGDVDTDWRDRRVDARALGLRRREDVDQRGQPGGEAPIAGEQPDVHDVDGSKAVACATGSTGQTRIASWRRDGTRLTASEEIIRWLWSVVMKMVAREET